MPDRYALANPPDEFDSLMFPEETAPVYDGAWRLFAYDPLFKRTIWILHQDGEMHFRVDFDVTQKIEENKQHRLLADKGWKGDGLHRIASVPLNTYYAELEPAKADGNTKYIDKWLNNSDNRAWRTKEGHIG